MGKLKLRDKLKVSKKKTSKSLSRYAVTINKLYVSKLENIKISNVTTKNDEISFYCNKKNLMKIIERIPDIEYEDCYKNYLLRRPDAKILSLIVILATIFIFFFNQITLREIVFEEEKYENEQVLEVINEHVNRVGPYLFLDDNIVNISKELRVKFYQYAYIGLSKKGSKLIITIVSHNVLQEAEEITNQIGEYYALFDAKITKIYLTSGTPLITIGSVVKKGDLLATSNIRHLENVYNEKDLKNLDGIILGEVVEYYSVKITKEYQNSVFTGLKNEYYELEISSKKYNFNKIDYLNKEVTKVKIADFKFCKLYKIIEYEKKIATNHLEKEDAVNYALMEYYQKFEKNRVSKEEKIVSTNLLKITEKDSYYELDFMIISHKNICEFKSFIR